MAPLATVRVYGHVLGRDSFESIHVLLDSGADYTQIPLAVARRLRLLRAGEKKINDQTVPTPMYYVTIELEGRPFDVSALGADDFRVNGEIWGLIGRDILNEAVVLDGPGRAFEIV